MKGAPLLKFIQKEKQSYMYSKSEKKGNMKQRKSYNNSLSMYQRLTPFIPGFTGIGGKLFMWGLSSTPVISQKKSYNNCNQESKSCCHLLFYYMEKQRHLSHEVSLAAIYSQINILKNPMIPCCPYAPYHEDNDFHVKGDMQFLLYLSEDVVIITETPIEKQQALAKLQHMNK